MFIYLKFNLFCLFIGPGILFINNNKILYDALFSDSLNIVNATLDNLDTEKPVTYVIAFKGALLMKKSGYIKTVAKKIEVFKSGHKLLEKSINENPKNAEFRFLRLTIQENAPKILKYNDNIDEDKIIIIEKFKKLEPLIQSFIISYAQQSEILKVEDLSDF